MDLVETARNQEPRPQPIKYDAEGIGLSCLEVQRSTQC